LFATLDCSPLIDVEHIDAALAIWDYIWDSVVCFFGDSPLTEVAHKARKVLDHLYATHPEPQGRSVIRDKALSGHATPDELDEIRAYLTDRHLIEVEKRPTGGAPEQVWKLADHADNRPEGPPVPANGNGNGPTTAPEALRVVSPQADEDEEAKWAAVLGKDRP
jgi:hypothetical protein